MDAATVKHLGTSYLDNLRSAKGKLKYFREPFMKYADGGAFGDYSIGNQTNSQGSSNNQPPKVETNIVFQRTDSGEVTGMKAETVWTSPEGQRMVIDTVVQDLYRNGTTSKIFKAVKNVENGNR